MLTREVPFEVAPDSGSRTRGVAVALLRVASRYLDTLAERMAFVPEASAPGSHVVEFHAEAGAPEGALYIDGKLVGTVVGVTRL